MNPLVVTQSFELSVLVQAVQRQRTMSRNTEHLRGRVSCLKGYRRPQGRLLNLASNKMQFSCGQFRRIYEADWS